MIKTVFLFVIAVSWAIPSFSQQSTFEEANALIEERNYREALSLYHTIAEGPHHSGGLWLNMGVAYSQLDSLGKAKFYFMRSQQYPETATLAHDALNYVENRLSRRSAVLPELPWNRFLNWMEAELGLRNLLFIALFLVNTAAALLLASWFFAGPAPAFRKSSVAAVVLSLLLFASAGLIHYNQIRYGTGVVVERQTRLLHQPAEESASVNTMYEGFEMRVDYHRSEEADGWFYVRAANGQFGWIRQDTIQHF
ncbi:MAG: hypothetical protein ACNA78_03190 [Balneolaceae bacterium]